MSASDPILPEDFLIKKKKVKIVMGFYPINLNLSGKKCLVVGGGKVALRKVRSLLKAEASIFLVAPKIVLSLKRLAKQKKIKVKLREFKLQDLKNIFLIIAATDDLQTNKKISQLAQKKNTLVNVADQPAQCNFFVPAVLRRRNLSVSVSTNGKLPAISRKIKEELKEIIPSEISKFILKLEALRKTQKNKLTTLKQQKFWQNFFDFKLLKDSQSNFKTLKKKIKKCL